MGQLPNVIYLAWIWVIPLVIAITFHEAAHGFVARFLGDMFHSDSVMGLLNSEVAPSGDVRVAVNETGNAASLEASTASENLPLPSASDVATISPRNISPSLLPDARLPGHPAVCVPL